MVRTSFQNLCRYILEHEHECSCVTEYKRMNNRLIFQACAQNRDISHKFKRMIGLYYGIWHMAEHGRMKGIRWRAWAHNRDIRQNIGILQGLA